jgi:hypothetical protein
MVMGDDAAGRAGDRDRLAACTRTRRARAYAEGRAARDWAFANLDVDEAVAITLDQRPLAERQEASAWPARPTDFDHLKLATTTRWKRHRRYVPLKRPEA